VVLLLTALFAATGNAALQDRLEPVLTGKINIAVDRFIVGTHDRYITNIVRDIDQETAHDLGDSLGAMLTSYGAENLVLVEKYVFDKNSKKTGLIERNLVLKSNLTMRIGVMPGISSDLQEVTPGSLEEFLWNAIAGPDGLGAAILGQDPEPVALTSDYKKPVAAERYATIVHRDLGGIFLDRNSITRTADGCSAVIVEAFNFDAEVHFGGMATQYAYQPYVDAHYAVSMYEYSFKDVALRLLRFTVFSPDGKVIYSIKNANDDWIKEDSDPTLPLAFRALYDNLPEGVAKSLAADIESFKKYVQERVAQQAANIQEQQDSKAGEQ